MPKLYETITKENWSHRGAFQGRHRERKCLLVHLQQELLRCGVEGWGAEVRILEEAARILYPERCGLHGIISFNDHPDTTVEDVIRVCKVADV